MKNQFLKGRIARITLVVVSFFLMTMGNFTQYVAGQANQFSPALGNFLFWFGLGTLAIPFLMTELTIAQNETHIRKLKEDMDIVKKKVGLTNEDQAAVTVKNKESEGV